MKTRTLKVDVLARVEGEGSLFLKIRGNKVQEAQLKIFEPPRFFEAFLRGRDFREAPDIAARICGICPVAYQMSAVHAMEDALGVKVEGPLRDLRRLLYCGEWIESHVLHIYFLHAPDFLGYQDAIQMAKDHGPVVERALKLKKIGNEIVALIGGREIHPVNVRVGGFYRAPLKKELAPLREKLLWAREAALETVRFTASLPFPEFEGDYEFVALRHEREYPYNEGRLVSSRGLDIPIRDYAQHFAEEHVEHSNALHSILKERGAYFTGPMARYNLNFDRLPAPCQQAAAEAGMLGPCKNPFRSIIIRAIETLFACDEAIRIIDDYQVPDKPAVDLHVTAGTGHGCTEAPRGILYHRYSIDDAGVIRSANIIPPTSQNQKTIEDDLRRYAAQYVHLTDTKLTWQCEQAIRNYDPCISCATHFLKLSVDRQ